MFVQPKAAPQPKFLVFRLFDVVAQDAATQPNAHSTHVSRPEVVNVPVLWLALHVVEDHIQIVLSHA